MTATIAKQEWRVDALAILAIILLGSFYAVWGAANATDRAFAIQMWTALAAFVGGGVMLVRYVGEGKAEPASRYENGVIKAGVIASMFWGVAGFLVGVVIRPAKGVGGARYQCETPRFDRDDAAKLTRILTVLFSLDPDGSALARMHEIASEQLRPRDARSCLF